MKQGNGLKTKKKSVRSYDFSNLYTSIPHDKLIDTITRFVKKVFNRKGKKYIIATTKHAYFSNKRSKAGLSLTAKELLDHIKFIVGNSYVKFQGKLYRQVVGIPMGTNCAPHLANIFLHVFEYTYIDSCIIEGNEDIAVDLNGLFRYQDDCMVFDDNGVFESHMQEIYPPEMTLNCTNQSPSVCSYLDLNISVYRGNFNYKSYDKRKDYKFEVVNYPNLSGNIPYKPSYGVFISQLVRFCNINRTSKYFSDDAKSLVSKLYNQGFNVYALKSKYLEFADRYISLWSKYGTDITNDKYMRYIFKLH